MRASLSPLASPLFRVWCKLLQNNKKKLVNSCLTRTNFLSDTVCNDIFSAVYNILRTLLRGRIGNIQWSRQANVAGCGETDSNCLLPAQLESRTMDQQQKISKLYSVLESMEVRWLAEQACNPHSAGALTKSSSAYVQGSLGGGGGFEGFYGSVTGHGVARVYASMQQHCQFDGSSFLVDIGGGVGRCVPSEHILIHNEFVCIIMRCCSFCKPRTCSREHAFAGH
jgi:hypothetical protein